MLKVILYLVSIQRHKYLSVYFEKEVKSLIFTDSGNSQTSGNPLCSNKCLTDPTSRIVRITLNLISHNQIQGF